MYYPNLKIVIYNLLLLLLLFVIFSLILL